MTIGELIDHLKKLNPEARAGLIDEWGEFRELDFHELYIHEPKKHEIIIKGE